MHQPSSISGEYRFAQLISYVFHPLLIPTYGMAILCKLFHSIYYISGIRISLFLIASTTVTTFILPALSALVFQRLGLISSLQMENRQERFLPYITTLLYYVFAFYLLRDFPVPQSMQIAMQAFIIAAIIAIFLTLVINFIWKISSHAVAAGGLSGFIAALCCLVPLPILNWLYLALLVSGIVAYARLKLHAHSQPQVYAGFLLGFGVAFLILFFL